MVAAGARVGDVPWEWGLCSRRGSLQCGTSREQGLAGFNSMARGKGRGEGLREWEYAAALAAQTQPLFQCWSHWPQGVGTLTFSESPSVPTPPSNPLQLVPFPSAPTAPHLPWLSQHPSVPVCASIPPEWGWGCGELGCGDSDRYKMGLSLLVRAGWEGTSKQSP